MADVIESRRMLMRHSLCLFYDTEQRGGRVYWTGSGSQPDTQKTDFFRYYCFLFPQNPRRTSTISGKTSYWSVSVRRRPPLSLDEEELGGWRLEAPPTQAGASMKSSVAAACGSLLGEQGGPVGLHLLQPFGEVTVAHHQLIHSIQSRAQLSL